MDTTDKPTESAPNTSSLHSAAPETPADRARIAIAEAAGASVSLLAELKLPRPEDSLRGLETALRQNRFTVLVCGEAKRGKSTFINALIGRNLLPTDVDIATSQVFQIRSGAPPFDQLAFQVRYEDDSAHYIEQDDLAKYGCQVVQDSMERSGKLAEVRPEQVVRQVEVTVPAGNLPPELTLLDTPGIGSLYSGHARITYRFIPFADAVIFVLDSQAPITEPELVFLSEIMTVTQNIFFLQTRIDQFQQKDWREVHDRNRKILTEKFGHILASPNAPDEGVAVWPVSSQNLLIATRTRSRELLQVSRFPAMLQALRRFLFETTGAQRAKSALTKLKTLHQDLQAVLEERAGVMEGGERAKQIEQARKQHLAAFASEWGPLSKWRLQTDGQLTQLLDRYRAAFHTAIAPGSSVETELQGRISALKDIADAERLARSLASDAVERVNLLWRQTTEEATDAVSDLISPLCGKLRGDAALMSHFFAQTLSVSDVAAAEQTERMRDTLANRARIAWQESGILGGVGAAVSMVLGRLFSRPVPGAPTADRFSRSGAELANKIKPELAQYLQNVLAEIRETYRSGADTSESQTEAFFTRLRGAAYDAMDSEYGRRALEEQEEARRLFELAAVTGDAAVAARAEAEHALVRWAAWGEHLRGLERSLDQAAEPPVEVVPPASPLRAASLSERDKLGGEATQRGTTPPAVTPTNSGVAAVTEEEFRNALRSALAECGPDGDISEAWEARLDELAEAAQLSRSHTRRIEREIREQSASSAV